MIQQLLKIDNNELLNMNSGKKFDVVLMNPPYGSDKSGDRYLHFKFTEKILDLSKKAIVIMPFRMLKSSSKKYDVWKQKLSKNLVSIEETNSADFFGTAMFNTGIYVWEENYTGEINIIYKNNDTKHVDSLLNVSIFSNYEENIANLLYNNKKAKYKEIKVRDTKIKKNKESLKEFTKNVILKGLGETNYFLLTNLANGGMSGRWISGNAGGIYDLTALYNYIIETNAAVKNIMEFNSKEEAENCKIALQNPVLRFVLYKLQDDQNINERLYKYVPDIDWSDDRVKTDEGLLEVCGCPKDKCKEYADYCKKIIENVDNKK